MPCSALDALEISPKQMVESPTSELNVGRYHGTLVALPYDDFKGKLQPWLGFSNSVQTMHESQAWQNACLGFRAPETMVPYTYGIVQVGDERGVNSRFHKYFGEDLNATFKSQPIGMRFASQTLPPRSLPKAVPLM